MRLKDYARNYKKRKDYVQKSELLMVGVDVSTIVVSGYRDQIAELRRQAQGEGYKKSGVFIVK